MGRRSLVGAARAAARQAGPSGPSAEALDNYVSIIGVPQPQTQSAAAEVAVLSVAVQVKYTGIFDVAFTSGFASGTTAKTVQHKLVVVPFISPGARFTGGSGNGTIYGNDVDAEPDTLTSRSKWGQRLSADAAGVPANGILFNGVAPTTAAPNGQALLDTGATPTLTGLLAGSAMTFSGALSFSSSVGPKTAYTKSTTAAPSFVVASIVLLSTAGGDVVTYEYASITLIEKVLP